MKIAESLMSIFIGVTIAWFILNMPKVSTYGPINLDPAPLETDDSNLALVGAGLATQVAKPSVMDAAEGPAPSVVLMNSQATMPMSPTPLTLSSGGTPVPPVTVVNPQMAMAPVTPPPMSTTMPSMGGPPQMMPSMGGPPQMMPSMGGSPQMMPSVGGSPQMMPPSPSS